MLGAYFGTGTKSGLLATFLMCCYDKDTRTYRTVCKVYKKIKKNSLNFPKKVANGFDMETLNKLQDELKGNLVKISQDKTKVPDNMEIHSGLVPDYIIVDPKKAAVWEIEV